MSDIVVITVKCLKAKVDLARLTLLLDRFLRERGFEVRAIMSRIEEDTLDDTSQIAGNTTG